MGLPPVTIQVCTYNRAEELSKTLHALEQIEYSGELQILVCDDHSPGDYEERVSSIFAWLGSPLKGIKKRFLSTPHNVGWGANVNNGLRVIQTPYIFFLEDDYLLTETLDLDPAVALMETKPEVGMVRYRGTAGSRLVYHQFEADISAHIPQYREGLGVRGKMTYLLLDYGSPELWIYSNGPHLKSQRFHAFYGEYPEGLKLGMTEELYAHIVKDDRMRIPGAPAIAILPDWIPMKWDHIGESYQLGELDKEYVR